MIKNFTLLPIAILLLIVAYSYDKINQISLSYYEEKMEAKIHNYEQEIINIFEDESFIEKAISFDFNESELKKLEGLSNNDYSIFIYQKPDSLVFWTSNKILPFDAEVEFSEEPISRFSTIKKGGYAVLNYPYQKDGNQYALIGLIPITQQYSIQNEYLVNGFTIIDNIPNAISLKFDPSDYEVNNLAGETLFYLDADEETYSDKNQQFLILLFYLSGLICLFWFLNKIANNLSKKDQSWVGVLFIIITVLTARLVTSLLGFDEKFNDLTIFSTKNFSSRSVVSIGNLLINAIIGLWLMIFAYRNFKLPKKIYAKEAWHRYLVFGVFFLIFIAIFLTTETFRRLVIYSNESFDINTLYSLNSFSLVGTISTSLILLTLFLFIVKLKILVRPLKKITFRQRLTMLSSFVVVSGILYGFGIFDLASLLSGIWGMITVVIAHFFIRQKIPGFLWLVGWICIYGAYSSMLFYQFNNLKEIQNRIFYAENLALERDEYMEESFDNVAATIAKDHFIKKISNLFIPRNRIIEQINGQYLKENFSNNYEYKVHLYTADSTGTKGEDINYDYFAKLISQSKSTNNPNLYYWNNNKGEQKYIADIPIRADNRKYYKIVILFEPKTIVKLSDYPDLLLDKSFDIQRKFEDYNYAIYNKGKIIKDKKGNFSEKLNFGLTDNKNEIIRKDEMSYLIHQTSDERVIIIEREVGDIGSIFSLFSYVFCLFLVLFSLLITINRLAERLPSGSFLDIRLPPSLRNKIQNNVVAIVVLAFIGIGVTTVFYFRAEAEDYHAGRLSRKARAVDETAKYEMSEKRDTFYLPDIEALDKIHKLNVNMYNPDGSIYNSSQQDIFTKNLLSFQMDPVAFHAIANLKQGLVYRTERIGNLEYSAAYMPVLKGENLVAIIGLPYYTEKDNSRKDIGTFMGRLLNVYVVIFIIAGIVTFYLTGQITNPLVQLSRQMQGVKLGQKNEKLSWETQDEIGYLIEEYNKMLAELERSADLLAKSEREGAWREMAKQVAHEIKNPLTPMKLQIQFLQRAYKSRPEDVGPLLKRTAYTLIEQIDGLTRIASDFSNFAKMPTANNEYLVLNNIVKSVFQLFSKEENIKLSLTLPREDCLIYADKDQTVRVLNNIIKNAIQAITFAVDYDREGAVDILLQRIDDIALVSIKDNGTGISDDKKNKVFVPNFTTKNSGTGLGLAMSKNIVEAANGRIYFETKVNVGTTFYVELPIKEMDV
ncbi:MAG: ATP-binding protein [Saprospiraceae bacterium]